ncbi:MAG: DnaA N-terminal domain-containing protein, partial [Chloroflexota bacterium]
PGIKRPVPFVLKRASGGYQAPEQFVRLAKMGLDDWLTCCLGYELGIEVDVPGRELWEKVYANYSVEAVPFVGELVGSLLDRMRARKEKRDESEEVNSGRWSVSGGSEPTTGHRPSTTGNAVGNAIWVKVLEQLAGQVSKMEMEIFLRPCVLLFGSVSNAAGWVLQAQDGSAEAYIRMVLAGKIEQVLAGLGISGGLQVTSGAVTDNVQRTTENEQLVTDPPNTEYRPTDHWLLDTVSLWDGVLAELQLALPASTYSTWLKDSALVPNGAGGYLVEVRNDQAKDWVQNRFFDLIVQIMAGILGNREFDLGVVSRK